MAAYDWVPNKATFNLDEVAELTGFSKNQLQRRCQRREIRHQRPGRQYVMTRDQVIELLTQTEVAPEVQPSLVAEAALVEKHRQRVAAKLGRRSGRPVPA